MPQERVPRNQRLQRLTVYPTLTVTPPLKAESCKINVLSVWSGAMS